MKKILCIFGILCITTLSVFAAKSINCVYTGNPATNFDNCSPKGGIQDGSSPDLSVTDAGSDFMTLIQLIVKQAQLVAFFIAVGIIIWIGLLMVLPANAEAKEATKGKLISVLLGFLAMISATIIINAVINLLYDIFK